MRLTIDFKFSEDATAIEAIRLVKGLRQEIRDRLPEGWEAKTRIDFGVDPTDDHDPC